MNSNVAPSIPSLRRARPSPHRRPNDSSPDAFMLTQDIVLNALKSVKYPGYSRDIVSFGLVKNVVTNQGAVSIGVELTSPNREAAAQIKQQCEEVLRALPEVQLVHVEVTMPPPQPGSAAAGPNPWAKQNKVPGLARII